MGHCPSVMTLGGIQGWLMAWPAHHDTSLGASRVPQKERCAPTKTLGSKLRRRGEGRVRNASSSITSGVEARRTFLTRYSFFLSLVGVRVLCSLRLTVQCMPSAEPELHRHATVRQSSHQHVPSVSKPDKIRIFTHCCSAL